MPKRDDVAGSGTLTSPHWNEKSPLAEERKVLLSVRNPFEQDKAESPLWSASKVMSAIVPLGVRPGPKLPLIESAIPLRRPEVLSMNPVIPVREPPSLLASAAKSVLVSSKLRTSRIAGLNARSN